jgi:hypothetical protein
LSAFYKSEDRQSGGIPCIETPWPQLPPFIEVMLDGPFDSQMHIDLFIFRTAWQRRWIGPGNIPSDIHGIY